MSLRKTRLVPAEPKVGRYRLFDWLPKGRRRCRLCGARMRVGNIWRHYERMGHADWILEDKVAFVLRARRSRRNRAHAQYQYATKGEPWRR
jgi:hypothetical protein